jgi:hypothetical protein
VCSDREVTAKSALKVIALGEVAQNVNDSIEAVKKSSEKRRHLLR